MHEIVEYSNELHELSFSSLSEAQQNVFFTLLQQLKQHDGYTLELDYKTVFELAQVPEKNSTYRKDILKRLGKLQTFTFMYEINDDGDLQQDVIFPSLATDSQNRRLLVKVSKGFKDRYISSPLKGWTKYELAEFVALNSTYIKTIYRYLKQFKSTGKWFIKYDDFKKLLGIPNSYRARDIDKQILHPAIKELSSERNLFDQRRTPFKNLKIIKHKSGRAIDMLEFSFDRQTEANDPQAELTQALKDLKQLDKEIKEQEMKINPITGQPVDELKSFIGKHFAVYNKLLNAYDTCKITNLQKSASGTLLMQATNQENGSSFIMEFENTEHLENSIKPY